MEAERASSPLSDNERAAREFVQGLQVMSRNFDRLAFDFAWAAGVIAGSPDAPARIRGMLEFAMAYHQFGLERALDAITDNAGIRTEVLVGRDGGGRWTIPGILVGLVGTNHSAGQYRYFDGVAVINDRRGRDRFVAVTIRSDGMTQLHMNQYDHSQPDLISDRPVEQIFPPTTRAR